MKSRYSLTRAGAALALAALGLATLPACAHRPLPPDWGTQAGSLLQVGVVDRSSGRELPIYRHRGEFWIAGTPGARYAIRLRNASGERVMAVISVDGVNVVTGETAGVGQTGYVFGTGQRSDIAGWRKSNSEIAAFEFTSLENAYASRTGRPDNIGVIGVAAFRERTPPPPPMAPPLARDEAGADQAREREAKAAAPEAGASADMATGPSAARSHAAPSPSLGTGHGRRESSYVAPTSFERAQAAPNEVIRIRYDSRERLVAAGIVPAPPAHRPQPVEPTPFPNSGVGYVPDPPSRF